MAAEQVNKRLIKAWMWWSLVWLTLFPLVGLLVSVKFHHPGFLNSEWFTFGRLRPVHVNGVIFGAFSTPFLGLLYYLIPRLCGRPMAKEHLGWWALAGWNVFLVVGSLSLLMGYNLGFEANEFEWPINILRGAVLGIVGGQTLVTIFRRRERGFYVSLWYTLAAVVWTWMNLVLGNVILPYVDMSGINNAALHGLFIHYIVGLWITPAGLAVMYYFIPLALKNPLFSHKLSLLGFWTLALFYPFVGAHHYTFSPIPYHTQTISIVTSIMLIIPVWAVITNFFGTALGRWGAIAGGKDADSYAAKFLLLATLYYLLGCFQGSVEALRRMQELTHFNDFVISHSHFTVFGTFVVAMVGAMYYVWPRVTGRELWSHRLASWHLWLTISGASLMFVSLSAQGFIQGGMLEYGTNFVDTVMEMIPWWIARTLFGVTMDIGFLLMAVNFIQTIRHGKPFEEAAVSKSLQARPAVIGSWFDRPSTVFLVAGIGFFYAAVIVQGVIPSLMPATTVPVVSEARTHLSIRVTDYTPEGKRGRDVYIREGCWYCHSQYIRPVTGESRRWGPVSQAGEYAYDQPQLLSTRRIGPDLTRVGRRYGDDWHIAHHWNPRDVVPDSIMPRFPWLFETPADGETPRMNDDGKALVAYLQRLGTNIGDWRETFIPTRLSGGSALRLSSSEIEAELIPQGFAAYQRRCIGCHGENGDGNGPAARFLDPKPRDFTTGIFKFRSTTGGPMSLPTDEDLFITITRGLRGTAMPGWHNIPADERFAVIQYIKTFSDRWLTEDISEPIVIPREPPIDGAALERGKRAFEEICALCHGENGTGNGPVADSLTDTWGNPVRPANFTLAAGKPGGVKLGHDARKIYRTVATGIGGTPMPAFGEVFSADELWDIVHYVQSLRVNAHVDELLALDLDRDNEALARQRIWASLSEAADRGDIDDGLLQARNRGDNDTVAVANVQEQ